MKKLQDSGTCIFVEEEGEREISGLKSDFVTMDEYENLPEAVKPSLPKRKHKPKPALTEEELHLIKDIEIPDGVNSGTW